MSIKTVNELEWHDGKEIPKPSTGSFLILTKNGGVAEAHKDVIAWCRLSDIKTPEGE
jgi:hypothetical protein